MSKERQRTRAAREAAAAQRLAAAEAERQVAAARRARAERRRLRWSRVRLWQRRPGSARRREQWGVLGTIVLLVLLVVYVWTRSFAAVAGTALVCVIGAPVLVMLVFHDRSNS